MGERHKWKHYCDLPEDHVIEHRVQFSEGDRSGWPGLYCETHKKWILVLHHDRMEVMAGSCVRIQALSVPFGK